MITSTSQKFSKMKVVLVCHSDNNGGAAVVTYRLMNGLRRAGVDASMLVYTRYLQDPNVQLIGSRIGRSVRFVMERVGIMRCNGFNRDDLFKVSTAAYGVDISSHPLVRDADVVLLSWVNQGLFSFKALDRLNRMNKPIVWVMHDMWCMTGICHHALGCENFTGECGNCKFLGFKASPSDLSHRIWQRKRDAYSRVPVTFVAVSSWLAEMAAKSSLLRDMPVEVIHNAFPISTFSTRIDPDRMPFDMRTDTRYILMGAARLDDPIKNLPMAVEALNIIFDEHPEVANSAVAVFFGSLRDSDALSELRFPHIWVGRIKDPQTLRDLFAAGHVVISTSTFECLPGTLIEGQASGCVPVSFGYDGRRDIITHKVNGYIARRGEARDFADGIRWALNAGLDPEAMHREVGERFAADAIASRFIDLFRRLLDRKKD